MHVLETTHYGFEVLPNRVNYENSNSFRRLFCHRLSILPALSATTDFFLSPPAALGR